MTQTFDGLFSLRVSAVRVRIGCMTFDALLLSRLAIALSAMVMLDAAPATAQRTPTAQTAPAPVPQPAPEPPGATPEPAPAKPENSGLLNELGKLFVKPADLFPGLKLSRDAAAPVASPAQPSDVSILEPPPTPNLAAPSLAAPSLAAPSVAAPKLAVPKLAVQAAPVPPPPAVSTTALAPAKPPATALVPQMMRGRASCPVSANGAPDCKAGADKLCRDNGFAGGSSLDTDSAQTCSTKALLAGARTIKDVCKTENFVIRAMCQ